MFGYIQSPKSHKDWSYGAVVQSVLIPSKSNNAIPKVVSQGKFGTCVSFASAYLKASQEAIDSKADVSRLMIYELCKEIDGLPVGTEGTTPIAAMQVLTKTGSCLETTFPYSLMGTNTKYTDAMVKEASNYKIQGYARCYTIDDIRQALHQSGALLIGISVTEAFYNAKTKFIPSVWGGQILGGHGLCVLNYDDNIVNPYTNEKGAVQIINSWGTGFGENGLIWLSYSQLVAKSDFGFTFMDDCFSSVDIKTGEITDPNKTTIKMQIGNILASVNGKQVTLDQSPVLLNGRTMTPARFVAENLGAQVSYDASTQTVTITK